MSQTVTMGLVELLELLKVAIRGRRKEAALELIDSILPQAKAYDASGGAVWHDIETAPKDGTKILVIKEYFDPYRKLPMSWHDIAYWTTHNSGGWVSATAGTPTHWRPLPPPPADGGAR